MFVGKNINHLFLISYLPLSVFLYGCNGASNEKRITENVMTSGDRIVAVNDFGELTITAGNGNKRYLTLSGIGLGGREWVSDTVLIQLNERKKRYNGSLGLYRDTYVKKIRQKGTYGLSKVIIEEAQLHFDTIEDVLKWLEPFKSFEGRQYNFKHNYNTWSSDGLYIQWHTYTPESWFIPQRTVLYVLVFQIYIGGDKVSPYLAENGIRYWWGHPDYYSELLNTQKPTPIKVGGHKPSDLPGASNDKVKVKHLTEEQLKEFEKEYKK